MGKILVMINGGRILVNFGMQRRRNGESIKKRGKIRD